MTTEAPTKRKPRSKARTPNAVERYLAASMNVDPIEERRETNADGVLITGSTTSLRVLYRPTTWGWESVQVPVTNLTMCLQNGMRVDCGDCHGNCSPDPMQPTPNACTGREKFATRICPECRKTIYDFGARVVHPHLSMLARIDEMDEGNEGTLIEDDDIKDATPATRTRNDRDQHILAFHPNSPAALLIAGGHDPRLIDPSGRNR